MKASKLHTFKELLTTGIKLDSQEDPINISSIFIPKIQRSYAQGRKEEIEVRREFLDDIFSVLTCTEDKKLELSFLFGSRQTLVNGKEGFELLDGQQRATTLFLLYWYLNKKEKTNSNQMPQFLKKFTYETRDSSIDFLKNITEDNNGISLEKASPSEAIKCKKWFTDEFLCDPTVCSMLTMLDAIDEKYKGDKCQNIAGNLERLCFYVLLLENFDMNDELYIKMNSRGLSLVPFENFKASIVRYMKAEERNEIYGKDEIENGETPFWLNFITKIDAEWIDLFWTYEKKDKEEVSGIIEIDDAEIGKRFFRFFNRFFFVKSVLKKGLEKEKLNPLSSFFYDKDPRKGVNETNRLTGWNFYEELFNEDPDCLKTAEVVLDRLRNNYQKIKDMVRSDPYGNTSDFDISASNITLHNRVAFAVIILFLERIPKGENFSNPIIEENFRQLLRVMHNVIENTLIEDAPAVYYVISAFDKILSNSDAINDCFYRSLATNQVKSRNAQIAEEIIKAKEMCSTLNKGFDKSWEDAFIEAEKHPFFKGSILFFFNEGKGTSSDFRDRYNSIKDLFDANGVSELYRKNHLLIRALISQINYWDKSNKGLKNRFITENRTQDKHLRQLLINYDEIRNLFCSYFSSGKPWDQYFEDVIQNSNPAKGEDQYFGLMFDRLTKHKNSIALFNWITEVESNKRPLCIQYNRNAYLINISGSWYDRILLDTERSIMAKTLKDKGFSYNDEKQQKLIESDLGDAWGWDLSLSKVVQGKTEEYKLQLRFQPWKKVEFIVHGNINQNVLASFGIADPDTKNTEAIVSALDYCYNKDFAEIEKEVNRIETILETVM